MTKFNRLVLAALVCLCSPSVAKFIGSDFKQNIDADERGDSEMRGRLVAVVLLPLAIALLFALFMGIIGKYKEHDIIRFIQGPSYGYLTVLGGLFLLFSLLGLATSAGAHDRAHGSSHPFDISYVKLLIAVNVLVFIFVASVMGMEFASVIIPSKYILAGEAIMLILTFAASVSAMDRFSSKSDYCEFEASNLSACQAYHAGIFFTWTVFFLMLFKFIVHALAMRAAPHQPNARPNVTNPQQSGPNTSSSLQQPMNMSSGTSPTVVQP